MEETAAASASLGSSWGKWGRDKLLLGQGMTSVLLQGVHESRGVTEDYLRLETLIQKVVSPYLGTYGLYSSEGPCTHSCILGGYRLGQWCRQNQEPAGAQLQLSANLSHEPAWPCRVQTLTSSGEGVLEGSRQSPEQCGSPAKTYHAESHLHFLDVTSVLAQGGMR